MDTIRYLLGAVLKLAFGLFLLVIVLWLVGLLFPEFKLSNIVSGDVFKRDWLPAPKNYGGLIGRRATSTENGKVYQPGPAFNGYGNGNYDGMDIEYVVYTASGTQVWRNGRPASSDTQNKPSQNSYNGYTQRSLYIRNLSVYEGGWITYGDTLIGEARDTMFKNGIFSVAVLDASGKIIGMTYAINTGVWATPGWARFQVTIPGKLPSNTPCSLVFISAQQDIRVGMNVRCR